jgi:hypothetical protein
MTPASPCLEKTNKNQRNVVAGPSLLVQIWKDGKEDGKEDGKDANLDPLFLVFY